MIGIKRFQGYLPQKMVQALTDDVVTVWSRGCNDAFRSSPRKMNQAYVLALKHHSWDCLRYLLTHAPMQDMESFRESILTNQLWPHFLAQPKDVIHLWLDLIMKTPATSPVRSGFLDQWHNQHLREGSLHIFRDHPLYQQPNGLMRCNTLFLSEIVQKDRWPHPEYQRIYDQFLATINANEIANIMRSFWAKHSGFNPDNHVLDHQVQYFKNAQRGWLEVLPHLPMDQLEKATKEYKLPPATLPFITSFLEKVHLQQVVGPLDSSPRKLRKL